MECNIKNAFPIPKVLFSFRMFLSLVWRTHHILTVQSAEADATKHWSSNELVEKQRHCSCSVLLSPNGRNVEMWRMSFLCPVSSRLHSKSSISQTLGMTPTEFWTEYCTSCTAHWAQFWQPMHTDQPTRTYTNQTSCNIPSILNVHAHPLHLWTNF